MNRLWKSLLSVALVLVMVVSILPAGAIYAQAVGEGDVTFGFDQWGFAASQELINKAGATSGNASFIAMRDAYLVDGTTDIAFLNYGSGNDTNSSGWRYNNDSTTYKYTWWLAYNAEGEYNTLNVPLAQNWTEFGSEDWTNETAAQYAERSQWFALVIRGVDTTAEYQASFYNVGRDNNTPTEIKLHFIPKSEFTADEWTAAPALTDAGGAAFREKVNTLLASGKYTVGNESGAAFNGDNVSGEMTTENVALTEDTEYVVVFTGRSPNGSYGSKYPAMVFQIADFTLTQVESTAVNGNVTLDGTPCATLEAALEAAQANQVIQLQGDVTATKDVVVTRDAILDLNGNTLTGNVTVTSGQLIDSKDGVGAVDGDVDVMPNNEQMPLKDASGNWKLFSYTYASKQVVNSETDLREFWFDIDFTNTDAYACLNDVSVSVALTYTTASGTENGAIVGFDTKVTSWKTQNFAEGNYALGLSVTGIDEDVTSVTVTPSFVSAGAAAGEAIVYTATVG